LKWLGNCLPWFKRSLHSTRKDVKEGIPEVIGNLLPQEIRRSLFFQGFLLEHEFIIGESEDQFAKEHHVQVLAKKLNESFDRVNENLK